MFMNNFVTQKSAVSSVTVLVLSLSCSVRKSGRTDILHQLLAERMEGWRDDHFTMVHAIYTGM